MPKLTTDGQENGCSDQKSIKKFLKYICSIPYPCDSIISIQVDATFLYYFVRKTAIKNSFVTQRGRYIFPKFIDIQAFNFGRDGKDPTLEEGINFLSREKNLLECRRGVLNQYFKCEMSNFT